MHYSLIKMKMCNAFLFPVRAKTVLFVTINFFEHFRNSAYNSFAFLLFIILLFVFLLRVLLVMSKPKQNRQHCSYCFVGAVVPYGTAVHQVSDSIPKSDQTFVWSTIICFGVLMFFYGSYVVIRGRSF